jgi:hypothetical protein
MPWVGTLGNYQAAGCWQASFAKYFHEKCLSIDKRMSKMHVMSSLLHLAIHLSGLSTVSGVGILYAAVYAAINVVQFALLSCLPEAMVVYHRNTLVIAFRLVYCLVCGLAIPQRAPLELEDVWSLPKTCILGSGKHMH